MRLGPRRTPPVLGLLLLGLSSGASGQSSAAAVSPKTRVAIGVAPFERVAAQGASVPDVAAILADRLATKGVDLIVGPTTLGASATAEPSAEEVLGWARRSEVEAVVVGRTTRLGKSLSIDVQVRSGHDGRVLATFVEEVARPDDLGGAIERLSEQVLLAQRNAPGPGEPVERAEVPAGSDARKGPFQGDEPIRISAAQLEAYEEEGRKRLVFTDDVRASQGDFELRSRKLEAFYPARSSQPDRLVATGNVVLSQANRTARCDSATYFRQDQRVVCEGRDAILTQDEDQLQGREITFHLDSQVLQVTGGASVRIQSGSAVPEVRP